MQIQLENLLCVSSRLCIENPISVTSDQVLSQHCLRATLLNKVSLVVQRRRCNRVIVLDDHHKLHQVPINVCNKLYILYLVTIIPSAGCFVHEVPSLVILGYQIQYGSCSGLFWLLIVMFFL